MFVGCGGGVGVMVIRDEGLHQFINKAGPLRWEFYSAMEAGKM